MYIFSTRILLSALLLAACSLTAEAVAKKSSNQRWGVGYRSHGERENIEQQPMQDGDNSFGVIYEQHENNGFWLFQLDYTPEVEGYDYVNNVLTPQINLLTKDRLYLGGLGIQISYVDADTPEPVTNEDGTTQQVIEDGWTDVFWQFILGLRFGSPGVYNLDIMAYYVFEDWGDVGDFDFGDMEYGVQLTWPL